MPLSTTARQPRGAFGARAPRRAGRAGPQTCRCEEPKDEGAQAKQPPPIAGNVVNEEVLAKLRAFEEENKKLKAQLEQQEQPDAAATAEAKKTGRIDGSGMQRETLFSSGGASNWISESDVDFFTGGSVGEVPSPGMQMTAEEQGTVQRRLAIGAVLTVVLGALALVPAEELDGTATKPVFYYLVPVLRSMMVLKDLAVELDAGNGDSVPLVVDRVLNKPNEVRKNMYSAVERLPNGQKQAAREVIGNFVDYVQQADYNTYFDVVGPRDGKTMSKYQEFSANSVRAAIREAEAFLKLFSYADVQEAREALAV